MLEEALFPRKLASNFLFLLSVLHFMLDPEPECTAVPVPLKAKSCGSVTGSGSTTLVCISGLLIG
jgi:hypothetical protein